MSKRDRAERAKNAGESTDEVGLDTSADSAADSVDEAASGDTATPARPTGKRSPRGKRTNLAKGDDGDDADSKTSAVSTKDAGKAEKKDGARKRVKPEDSRNPFTRLYVFLTQVVGELKKVIWPSRKQLIQYTIIVLIFVILMVAFISALDLAFAKGVLWLFG